MDVERKGEMMESKQLMTDIKTIFWNNELTDDEVANLLLDKLDENREIVQFDSSLNGAHRILNVWSRTETETGIFLDQVKDILNL